MTSRRGEQLGWTLGWSGAFVWVAILAVVFLVQGQILPALAGLVLVGLAAWTIRAFAPWRRPTTPYWQLLLPFYLVLLLTVAWAVWAYGGPKKLGMAWWNALWLLTLLIPLGPTCKRTWNDHQETASHHEG